MEDIQLIVKASNFAAIKHINQRRKDKNKSPYINHPLGVTNILTSEGQIFDVNVLVAALLHDTVEDTDTTFEELKKEFGEKIANIVMEVTDDKSLSKVRRKQLQIEKAKGKSLEAKLVKLADKLYNCRDLLSTPPSTWAVGRIQGYSLLYIAKCNIKKRRMLMDEVFIGGTQRKQQQFRNFTGFIIRW
ncbi:metal-dependent phosphohydrolase [Orpheovirus IHUMI-LCC2]|uniref:3'5'-cyclic nucleotide phosphodiesterase n=1 Tax=Orpheovirus IHUMI-LCC2 TaxID=2023057 RepID=A0A2I2L310_9VIRU|nr:metal-dependent phosphohydrolase [Orpheovirus IHUMI-LCC2]SNW61911.1 3'5'-cyclic nucleotide phosphodiesterase [Orpheovirus IHUMI-LCC2]